VGQQAGGVGVIDHGTEGLRPVPQPEPARSDPFVVPELLGCALTRLTRVRPRRRVRDRHASRARPRKGARRGADATASDGREANERRERTLTRGGGQFERSAIISPAACAYT